LKSTHALDDTTPASALEVARSTTIALLRVAHRAAVMVVMMAVTGVVLRKDRCRKEQEQGQSQQLFHAQKHSSL
jgi:hypothetical protein